MGPYLCKYENKYMRKKRNLFLAVEWQLIDIEEITGINVKGRWDLKIITIWQ